MNGKKIAFFIIDGFFLKAIKKATLLIKPSTK
jgi:hypothetical protein